MKLEKIIEKRIYRYWPNGSWRRQRIVRVLRKGGAEWLTVVGPNHYSIPYNFAPAEHLHKASLLEVQMFVEAMP